jgi:arylsulfatase
VTAGGTTGDFDNDKWELYNLADDFSEANDLSAKYPQKLKELQDDFWVEAKKYDVLPLDDRFAERGDPRLRPSLIAGRTDFIYFPGATRIPEPSAADTKNASHTITASIEVPQGGADGVLVAEGGAAGGYTLYIKDGKPVYEYNYFAHERYKVTSSETLSPGPNAIRVDFKYDGGIGKGGTASLFINDKKVGEGRIEKTCPSRFGAESFDVGMDNGSPVSEAYDPPFAYAGTIKKVEINTRPSALSSRDQQTIRDKQRAVAMGME